MSFWSISFVNLLWVSFISFSSISPYFAMKVEELHLNFYISYLVKLFFRPNLLRDWKNYSLKLLIVWQCFYADDDQITLGSSIFWFPSLLDRTLKACKWNQLGDGFVLFLRIILNVLCKMFMTRYVFTFMPLLFLFSERVSNKSKLTGGSPRNRSSLECHHSGNSTFLFTKRPLCSRFFTGILFISFLKIC